MSDESTLRRKAREAIEAGKLPNRRPDRMWGGPGVGAHCAICALPIERDEVEFELQFSWDDTGGLGNYHVHVRCFAAWELERETAEAARMAAATEDRARVSAAQCTTIRVPQSSSGAASASAVSSSRVLPAAGEDGMMPRRERDPPNNRGPA